MAERLEQFGETKLVAGPVPRMYKTASFDWTVLYQVGGYSHRQICDQHQGRTHKDT